MPTALITIAMSQPGNMLESRQHGVLQGILGVFMIAEPAQGYTPEEWQVVRQKILEFFATF